MQAHYFVSFIMKINKDKQKEIEDNNQNLLYKELLNDYGFVKS